MKKITSIFLSLLLLLSSMGFTVSTHICDGQAMKSALTVSQKPLDCGMMDMKQECTNHQDGMTAVSKSACCSNEYSTYTLEDDFISLNQTAQLGDSFLFALAYTYLLANIKENDEMSYIIYSPPVPHHDITVMHQSFLI